jgi:hypothetical protein
MCIKDYKTEIGGQGPVRAVELLEKKACVPWNYAYMSNPLIIYSQ